MHCNSFGILRKRWWCNKRSLSERHGIRQRLLSICDRDGWKILKLKSKVVLWFKDVKDGGIKEATSHAKKRSNKSAAAADGKSNVLRLVLWQGPKPGACRTEATDLLRFAAEHAGPENHKTFKNLNWPYKSLLLFLPAYCCKYEYIFTKIGMNFDLHTL